jgi:deazaflavin-dependent oxidoreductase (nitroreductase family)
MSGGFNANTIAEFRKNHGKVGGYFEGAPLVIMHTIGARTRKPHVVPVMYLRDREQYVVFASKGGSPKHPDWYHNLKANPDIQIEVGDDTFDVHAEEMLGGEHDRLYQHQSKLYPRFAEYQHKTRRIIPVIAFTKKK